MAILILGLAVFLGMHSIRIVADDWRTVQRNRYSEHAWKAGYSIVSIIGFILIVVGYGMARQEPVILWAPPVAMRHIAALLTAISFVLISAAYVPRNSIKAVLHHPMLLGVKLWAFAHLLANGMLADVILFGSFLIWAVFCFRAARQRDKAAMTQYPAGTAMGTIIAVVVGLVIWALFAFWLHGLLIGVRPFA
jgi:uncharacterized membrane protein